MPPPRLERVSDDGYTPPPIRRGATPTPSPASGLRTVEVTAEVAIRAGIRHRGDLARDSTLRLLCLVAAHRATGRLLLLGRGCEFALAFRDGTPQLARSTDPTDDLVRSLLDEGVLHPSALVRPGVSASEYDLVDDLLRHRRPEDVARLVRDHGTRIIIRALRTEEGRWEWEPQVQPGSLACALGSPLPMLSAAVRGMDAATLRRRLGARCNSRVVPVAGAVRVEELGLTPDETAAAQLFEGDSSPLEIATFSAVDAATVFRTALILFETGLLVSQSSPSR